MSNIGRLAFRVEGEMWNAYYALPDTMKDAIWIGSIAMRFVEECGERKRTFMLLMREAVSDIIEEKTGCRPEWPEPEGHVAPVSETSGRLA